MKVHGDDTKYKFTRRQSNAGQNDRMKISKMPNIITCECTKRIAIAFGKERNKV
jgi:hypothetical protein